MIVELHFKGRAPKRVGAICAPTALDAVKMAIAIEDPNGALSIHQARVYTNKSELIEDVAPAKLQLM